jgi:hypothetical protein
MTLKNFKDDFRLICTDTWGDALESWFECAGQMYSRFLEIPVEWEYNVGAGDGTDPDSYFHEVFLNATDSELIAIGNFLFRYCEYLRFKKVNY